MALGLYLLPAYVDQPRFSSLFFGLVRILQFECADPFMNAREKKKDVGELIHQMLLLYTAQRSFVDPPFSQGYQNALYAIAVPMPMMNQSVHAAIKIADRT